MTKQWPSYSSAYSLPGCVLVFYPLPGVSPEKTAPPPATLLARLRRAEVAGYVYFRQSPGTFGPLRSVACN